VRLRLGELTAEWQGRFTRLREQLDPRTRTLGVVVAVDDPYQNMIPGQRPPLFDGMFCEVELRGRAESRIVVPRVALHNQHVYLVDESNRLVRREVKIAFPQSTFVAIEEGLTEGETLVVSDPTPAVEGMLVEPVLDELLQASLAADAAGEGTLP
jgi:multidrug efflux pump subunit AcrA (membrane-fusion protein)